MIASVMSLENKQSVSRYKSSIREKLAIESRGNIALFINKKLDEENKKRQV
jgi:hypothetical protein